MNKNIFAPVVKTLFIPEGNPGVREIKDIAVVPKISDAQEDTDELTITGEMEIKMSYEPIWHDDFWKRVNFNEVNYFRDSEKFCNGLEKLEKVLEEQELENFYQLTLHVPFTIAVETEFLDKDQVIMLQPVVQSIGWFVVNHNAVEFETVFKFAGIDQNDSMGNEKESPSSILEEEIELPDQIIPCGRGLSSFYPIKNEKDEEKTVEMDSRQVPKETREELGFRFSRGLQILENNETVAESQKINHKDKVICPEKEETLEPDFLCQDLKFGAEIVSPPNNPVQEVSSHLREDQKDPEVFLGSNLRPGQSEEILNFVPIPVEDKKKDPHFKHRAQMTEIKQHFYRKTPGETKQKAKGNVFQEEKEFPEDNQMGESYFKMKFYCVQSGEDLDAVAYKLGVSKESICQTNLISEEDIRTGMLLSIPK